jgi:hypothetical protein
MKVRDIANSFTLINDDFEVKEILKLISVMKQYGYLFVLYKEKEIVSIYGNKIRIPMLNDDLIKLK